MDEVKRAVEALQRGENPDKSFRILFDRYHQPVQRFFAQRVFSPEDRLDLTQETFLRVYRGIGGFRGESRFGTWLFRVAANTHLKWVRRQAVREHIQEPNPNEGELGEGPADPNSDPLDDSLEGERRQLLHRAIGELPEKMRRCVVLRVEQDLSYREIAALLRLSTETVKVHLFQARKRLRDSLGEIEL